MPLRTDRLRDSRKKQDISQRDLASLCGFGEYQIYRYENGKSDPSATHLAIMSEKLGVSADYLLGLTAEPHGLISRVDLSAVEYEVVNVLRRNGWRGLIRLVTDQLTK
jgi:transcriptional regulator with XRE-family HTH domain